jgi:hypothetical protein
VVDPDTAGLWHEAASASFGEKELLDELGVGGVAPNP